MPTSNPTQISVFEALGLKVRVLSDHQIAFGWLDDVNAVKNVAELMEPLCDVGLAAFEFVVGLVSIFPFLLVFVRLVWETEDLGFAERTAVVLLLVGRPGMFTFMNVSP